MPEPFTVSDRRDKDNPHIQFIPPVHYTKTEVEAEKNWWRLSMIQTFQRATKKIKSGLFYITCKPHKEKGK